jgi:hypothetical protein
LDTISATSKRVKVVERDRGDVLQVTACAGIPRAVNAIKVLREQQEAAA